MRAENRSRPSQSIRIDIHEWNGQLADRMKAHTTERDKGAFMVNRLKELFNLSDIDIAEITRKENEKLFQEQNLQPRPFLKDKKPISWKRDARGNLI